MSIYNKCAVNGTFLIDINTVSDYLSSSLSPDGLESMNTVIDKIPKPLNYYPNRLALLENRRINRTEN